MIEVSAELCRKLAEAKAPVYVHPDDCAGYIYDVSNPCTLSRYDGVAGGGRYVHDDVYEGKNGWAVCRHRLIPLVLTDGENILYPPFGEWVEAESLSVLPSSTYISYLKRFYKAKKVLVRTISGIKVARHRKRAVILKDGKIMWRPVWLTGLIKHARGTRSNWSDMFEHSDPVNFIPDSRFKPKNEAAYDGHLLDDIRSSDYGSNIDSNYLALTRTCPDEDGWVKLKNAHIRARLSSRKVAILKATVENLWNTAVQSSTKTERVFIKLIK